MSRDTVILVAAVFAVNVVGSILAGAYTAWRMARGGPTDKEFGRALVVVQRYVNRRNLMAITISRTEAPSYITTEELLEDDQSKP